MHKVDFSYTCAAPPADVFAKASDHEHFFRGWPIDYCRLKSPGEPAPNGLGAVREVRNMGVRFVERVTHFEPNLRLDYQVIECGVPLTHEWGRVDFIPTVSGGTTVRWRSQFSLELPLHRLLEKLFGAVLRHEIIRLLKQVDDELKAR